MKSYIKKNIFVSSLAIFILAVGFSGCKNDSDSGNSHAPKITAMWLATSEENMKNKIYITSAKAGESIYIRFNVTDEEMDDIKVYTTFTSNNLINNYTSNINTSENRTSATHALQAKWAMPSITGNWTITIQVEDAAGNLSNKYSRVITLS